MSFYDLSTQRPQLRENFIITALVKRVKDLERRVARDNDRINRLERLMDSEWGHTHGYNHAMIKIGDEYTGTPSISVIRTQTGPPMKEAHDD